MNLVLDRFSSKQTLECNDGQTMEDPHGERISHPQPFLVCSASTAPVAGGTMMRGWLTQKRLVRG
jgi:hypothetical protein